MDPVRRLKELMTAVKDGKMKAILDDASPYRMDDFQAMFEKQMSHTAHGKLVLQIKGDAQPQGKGHSAEEEDVDEKEQCAVSSDVKGVGAEEAGNPDEQDK